MALGLVKAKERIYRRKTGGLMERIKEAFPSRTPISKHPSDRQEEDLDAAFQRCLDKPEYAGVYRFEGAEALFSGPASKLQSILQTPDESLRVLGRPMFIVELHGNDDGTHVKTHRWSYKREEWKAMSRTKKKGTRVSFSATYHVNGGQGACVHSEKLRECLAYRPPDEFSKTHRCTIERIESGGEHFQRVAVYRWSQRRDGWVGLLGQEKGKVVVPPRHTTTTSGSDVEPQRTSPRRTRFPKPKGKVPHRRSGLLIG